MTMIGLPVLSAVEPFVRTSWPQKINGKSSRTKAQPLWLGFVFDGLPFELLPVRKVAKMSRMKTKNLIY
jgi:hypothetical protein